MQIQILQPIASAVFGLEVGDIVERDELTARAWCASGVARHVDEPEAAMRQAAPERAVRGRAKGRR